MLAALSEAQGADSRGEVPVGAVIVKNLKIIARAGNKTIEKKDPTAHAEIIAIRKACQRIDSQYLINCDLYVTIEPCTQCTAAISLSRLQRLYFGAENKKGGAVINGVRFFDHKTCYHRPEYYSGFYETSCKEILKKFFLKKR
ncbi:nucleoside deaminase [Candidatus Endowatersipora endosymbiont of Watersipora subatra]|uniref:nucleoside deaminase n=1 Tax=Candidatus Endowatersipora endosymbiont of Watersipora subatra TaxID=3077946 RepID=UPI003C7D755F